MLYVVGLVGWTKWTGQSFGAKQTKAWPQRLLRVTLLRVCQVPQLLQPLLLSYCLGSSPQKAGSVACGWELCLWCSVVLGTASWEADGVASYSKDFQGGGGGGGTFTESWKPWGRGCSSLTELLLYKALSFQISLLQMILSSWAFLWSDRAWPSWWVKSQGPSSRLRVNWLAWVVSALCI